jgi:hypothetical protein
MDITDYNYIRYIGWSENNKCIQEYYSDDTVNLICKKITELTMGVNRDNRPIVVPKQRVRQVMDSVYQTLRPPVGDIYSRYIVPNENQPNMIDRMIDQTIEVCVSNIRDSLGIEENNQSLSIWSTLYGDFNVQGLRQYPPIKIRGRRPATMQFNMTY